MDPLHAILRAHDRAIHACEAFDHATARQALGLLRHALELDTAEARSFDSLYARCESAVDQRDFVGPARRLRTLREAWSRAGEPRPLVTRTDRPLC